MSYLDNPSSVLNLVTDDEAHRDVYIAEDVYELYHNLRPACSDGTTYR